MKEFDKLFNIFTIFAIVVILIITVVSASITVIEKGKSNLYSVNATRNEIVIRECCINLV